MMIGKRINGRYKVLEMVGGGGMANVYLAHDMILDRDVAVKVLRLDFANDEELIRRFRREAQSATSLVHQNIVSIYDVGEEDNSVYYIVMEYVEGQTLKQYIQQHSPIPVSKALAIMEQLTSAISHAHQNHIIHRDIKPQNILMDLNGNVKITDFGIAMALSATSITQTNSVLGSVHYLSPEQARGGTANHKSDIYSLGIVMFELLTGRLPFSGESAVSIALKHLQSETPSVRRWNPAIPQSVENIVLKATTKDPFYRYENVEEMEEDIRTSLDDSRMDEPKFNIPEDNDATKAIPIITNERSFSNLDETIIHDHETKVNSSSLSPKEKKEKDKVESKGKRNKLPLILVSIFSILIILGILTFTVLPTLLSPKDIEVPDVSGMELDEAIVTLNEAGFMIGDTKEVTHEEIQKDLVIRTDPKAGRSAKEGTKINIIESLGKATFELSDYSTRKYDDVLSLLNSKGFKDIKKTEDYDETAEIGTIIEQNYPEGYEAIPDETVLEFRVSKGPALIEVKDLTGYNATGVQEYAGSVGLFADVSQKQFSSTVPEGVVISQKPEAGTKLEKGSKITTYISKGPEAIPPKKVQVEIIVPYDPEIEGEPQEVQIFVEDMYNNIAVPFYTDYITENLTKTIELTIAQGKVANYQVRRDKNVIMDKTVPYPVQP